MLHSGREEPVRRFTPSAHPLPEWPRQTLAEASWANRTGPADSGRGHPNGRPPPGRRGIARTESASDQCAHPSDGGAQQRQCAVQQVLVGDAIVGLVDLHLEAASDRGQTGMECIQKCCFTGRGPPPPGRRARNRCHGAARNRRQRRFRARTPRQRVEPARETSESAADPRVVVQIAVLLVFPAGRPAGARPPSDRPFAVASGGTRSGLHWRTSRGDGGRGWRDDRDAPGCAGPRRAAARAGAGGTGVDVGRGDRRAADARTGRRAARAGGAGPRAGRQLAELGGPRRRAGRPA